MRSFIKYLSPSQQNTVQRVGFFCSLAMVVIVFMLHFPFDGYYYQESVVIKARPPNCVPDIGNITLDDLKKMNRAELEEHTTRYKSELTRCGEEREERTLPPWDWVSVSSIVDWFAPLSNAMISIVFIVFLGSAWLWIFRPEAQNQRQLN